MHVLYPESNENRTKTLGARKEPTTNSTQALEYENGLRARKPAKAEVASFPNIVIFFIYM